MEHIAIHSVPRSGSTWLGSIFDSHPNVAYRYQPLFSYAFKDYLDENSSPDRIEEFFMQIKNSNDSFINQKEAIGDSIVPNFQKKEITHICYKEVRYHHILKNLVTGDEQLKLILLVRNPLAVLQSWKEAPKEFRKDKGWNFKDEWLEAPSKNLHRREEFNGYLKWKEAAQLFLHLREKYPDKVSLITYNVLLKQTEKIVRTIFQFCNLAFPEQTKQFLNQSKKIHKEDAYSVYKKKIEDEAWKKLPKDIIAYVHKDLEDSELKQFLHE